ncbi:MAG: nucleotidyltransferase domain-containing protein [Chloroflexota bacterium]
MSPDLVRHQHDVEQLCRAFHVRRLDLFGSAARGTDRPGESDLDFLVEFDELPPGAFARAYLGLLAALEDLFHQPIDLVVDSTVVNPYLRKAIDATKVPLFAA